MNFKMEDKEYTKYYLINLLYKVYMLNYYFILIIVTYFDFCFVLCYAVMAFKFNNLLEGSS